MHISVDRDWKHKAKDTSRQDNTYSTSSRAMHLFYNWSASMLQKFVEILVLNMRYAINDHHAE